MKNYFLTFGAGDPRGFTGLAPTFLLFQSNIGTGFTPPAISETQAGKTGIYTFSYGTTSAIAFLIDGATTSLGNGRYVTGSIDPADRADEYGNTLTAYGQTTLSWIGTNADSFGNTSTDPASIFGFLKRAQEFFEGDQTYTKATGFLQFFNRGSSTLLRQKTVTDSSTTTTKTGL